MSWRDLLDWTDGNGGLLSAVAAASALTLVASALLLPLVIARMPHDYFTRAGAAPASDRPALARIARICARNALGAVLLVAGLALLVLPGQGLLTILAALLCMTFPAKRRLLRSIARRPSVLRGLNWVRRRTGSPPFAAPPPTG